MTRQPRTQSSQSKRHAPTALMLLTLTGLIALGQTFAETPLDSLFTYAPLVLVALGSHLVLRTQYSR